MNTTKCPHCGAKLGNFVYADACPHCHRELKHNTLPLVPSTKSQPAEARSWPARTFDHIRRLVES